MSDETWNGVPFDIFLQDLIPNKKDFDTTLLEKWECILFGNLYGREERRYLSFYYYAYNNKTDDHIFIELQTFVQINIAFI